MCPRRGNDPASGHPRAHQPPLGRGTSPPAWDGRLDAPGQRRRHLPSSAWTRRREVKQGKSGGSVGTTDQGKGKGRSVVRPMGTVAYRGKGQGKGKGRGEGRLGQGGRGRSKGGEKLMGTTAYGGKGSKGRAANGDRPVGAASCRRDHHTMASCQNPPRPKVTIVGKNEIYNRENLVGPFVVHKLLGPRPFPPNTSFKHSPDLATEAQKHHFSFQAEHLLGPRPRSGRPGPATEDMCDHEARHSAHHNILLLGEGNLSFALSLVQNWGTGRRMVVTTFEPWDVLRCMYHGIEATVQTLHDAGCKVWDAM